jgi:micrococcal nuclease
MGAMTPPSRKSCYNFRVIEINRVVDGDTIDVTIDLGFDLYKKERVRVAGVDTPEKRTRDLDEKELGIDATNWMKEQLEGAIDGDDDLIIRTELVGGMGKYGRLLGWLYIGDAEVSLNEQMITEGYAEARKKWCNCVTEFGEMVSEEVKTNPRYNNMRTHFGTPEPDR